MMFAPGSFTNSANASPDEIARKRAMIAALMPRFGQARYVGEGIGQLATGVAIGRRNKQLDAAEATGKAGAQDRFASLFGGMRGTAQPGGFSVLGSMPVEQTPAQGVADDTMTALGQTPMRPYRDAIASIESDGSGGYAAIGPTNPTLGRAMGRYQVMEANIGPWSKEVLGREVSPQEFMENPQLQDAIFDGKFGGYVDQYGPEGAAQAWFAGPGGVGKTDRQDVLGTSVGDYTQKFSSALGGAPQGQPMAGPQGAAASVPIDALYGILSDPWQSPENKAIAQQMIQQQQQLMDPAYQMGLEKTRLELNAMRNPKREPIEVGGVLLDPDTFQPIFDSRTGGDNPASVQEYQYYAEKAQARGETPMPYEQFITLDETAGNPSNGPDLGKLSQDYTYEVNPDGSIKRDASGLPIAVAVPGSPAAIEAANAAAAKNRRQAAKFTEADTIITAARRAREAAGSRDLGAFGSSLVGSIFPQSDSGEVIRQVNTLKANGTFSALQQMRDNSPTGAALGSASDRDLQLLADKAGTLDPSSPNIQRDLDDYERALLRTLYGPEEGDAVFEQSRQGSGSGGPSDDDLLNMYGGGN